MVVIAQVSLSSADRTWISERASRKREGNAVAADSVVVEVGQISVDEAKERRLEKFEDGRNIQKSVRRKNPAG